MHARAVRRFIASSPATAFPRGALQCARTQHLQLFAEEQA